MQMCGATPLYRAIIVSSASACALTTYDTYRILDQPSPLAVVIQSEKSGGGSLVRLERIRLLPRPLQ